MKIFSGTIIGFVKERGREFFQNMFLIIYRSGFFIEYIFKDQMRAYGVFYRVFF